MTALAMNATALPFAAAAPSLALTPASFRDALKAGRALHAPSASTPASMRCNRSADAEESPTLCPQPALIPVP